MPTAEIVTTVVGKIVFPDPNTADENGVLALGGNFNVDTLVAAYSLGIFPWPQSGYTYLWFSPNERGVLFFKDLHVPKSLQKEIKKCEYQFTFNKAFEQVIKNCAKSRRQHEEGTWINRDIIAAYGEFHRQGYAHSVECWLGKELVGGLYGVWVSGVFMGESMFFLKPNTSKMCLLKLIEFLKSQGHEWMDTQMVTPVFELLGGRYISRSEFLGLLKTAQKKFTHESLEFPLAPGDNL